MWAGHVQKDLDLRTLLYNRNTASSSHPHGETSQAASRDYSRGSTHSYFLHPEITQARCQDPKLFTYKLGIKGRELKYFF